ncbi:MAG: hypothetical protein Q605_AUC00787G0006 [Actinomyces urogenitalis DORA_12]|uniref:Uncharacterized protein n=1 Tax=Actinomyces urogenitalis DORA_12 TaxID=1403939 RepID=W1VIF6_9ACTO|nr:MAG: hypothetical protein Q605_AUC00787G0006 [Actinomyces urogenitalis DORA_12]
MARDRALEDGRGQLVADALALVSDVNEDAVPALGAAHADRGGPRPVAQRVLDHRGQDLRQGAGGRQDRQPHLVPQHDLAPGSLEGRLPLLPLLVKDVAEVQRLGAPTAGAPRDPQEVLDHPGQPVDLLDAGTRLRPGLLVPCQQLHLLQAQAQRGQGRAQLVGGVRGELPLCRQAPGHALSRSHELSLDQVDLLDP